MKRAVNILLALCCSLQTALPAEHSKAIQEFVLDERVLFTVPVAMNGVTTISFPGPVSAIEAAQVTLDGKTPGLFQIAHTKGSYFFSVRALVKKAATNVNVRWNNKTYVIELVESDSPLFSVIFRAPAEEPPDHSAPIAVTPTRLLALLDKSKAYPLLKRYHPEAVADVDYTNYTAAPQIMDYKTYQVQIDEAFRFNPEDTLVFRLSLRNKTDHPMRYRPDGFSLRIGERLYPQSISDASGVIPPNSQTPAYFAVTGTPNGGRNDISLKNKFIVLLDAAPVNSPSKSKP